MGAEVDALQGGRTPQRCADMSLRIRGCRGRCGRVSLAMLTGHVSSLRRCALAITALVALAGCSPPAPPLPDAAPMDASVSMDAAANCPAGQSSCSGSCADLQTDRRNCGACGAACAGASVCAAGRCVPTCPAGQSACGDQCVSTASDPLNCGACGTRCPAGQVCSRGVCDVVCAATLTLCTASSGAGDGGAGDGGGLELCVDTRTDDRHCGMCGRSCAAGESCVGGSCQVRCAAGQTTCSGRCANLQSDP